MMQCGIIRECTYDLLWLHSKRLFYETQDSVLVMPSINNADTPNPNPYSKFKHCRFFCSVLILTGTFVEYFKKIICTVQSVGSNVNGGVSFLEQKETESPGFIRMLG